MKQVPGRDFPKGLLPLLRVPASPSTAETEQATAQGAKMC